MRTDQASDHARRRDARRGPALDAWRVRRSNRRRRPGGALRDAAVDILGRAFPRLLSLRRYAAPPPAPAGHLVVAPAAIGRVRFGDWTVEVLPDSFRLSAPPLAPGDRPRTVWLRRGAFLGAGFTRAHWTDNQGSLSLRPVRLADTAIQRVDVLAVEDGPDGPTAVLRGTLRGHGIRPRPWVLRLTSAPERPEHCAITLDIDIAQPDPSQLTPRTAMARKRGEGPEGPHPTVRVLADLRLDWRTDPRGRLHGLGEQFTDFALNEAVFAVLSREQGIGRGRQPLSTLVELAHGAGGAPTTTYAPLPLLLRGDTAVMLDTTVPSLWDLRRNRVAIEAFDSHLTAFFVVPMAPADRSDQDAASDAAAPVHDVAAPTAPASGPPRRPVPSSRDLLQNLTALTGRMRGLPDQVQRGMILGAQGGSAIVRRKVAALENAGAELAGVWVQDWAGRRDTEFGARLWWTWQLDRDLYPDFEDLTSELAARGIAMYTYVSPAFADPSEHAGRPGRDLWTEAADRGHLVLDPTGRRPYRHDQHGFHTGLVDLSNPQARDWLTDVLAHEVALPGVKGWMADFAEGVPMDAVLANGSTLEWRNRWPTTWAEVNRAAIERSGLGDEAFVFHRSAGVGSAASAGGFWAGDQLTSWDRHDGLASALHGMLSGGVSGMTLTHSDVGGYTALVHPLVRTVRDAELLQRWAELGAWGTVMRTHESNQPDAVAQPWDPNSVDGIALQSRVFAALADYRRRVVAEAVEQGLPALRHGWVEHPRTAAAGTDDQFFFGSDFLVAPVLTPGAGDVEAVLPAGDWAHLWTGRIHRGPGPVTVPAPLGQPGVFHRPGRHEELAARLRDLVAE